MGTVTVAATLGAVLFTLTALADTVAHRVSAEPFPGWQRLDARLKLRYQDMAQGGSVRAASEAATAEFYVQSRKPAVTASELFDLGARVGTLAGDVLTVRAHASLLPRISGLKSVIRLEGAGVMRPQLDLALPSMRADRVHAGTGLNQAYLGAGVVMGVIDNTGLDYRHAAFLGEDGKTRVVGLWDQSAPSTGAGDVKYGATCDAASLKSGECKHRPTGDHGTAVAGVAAGAPVKAAPYVGFAPKAEIFFVNSSGRSATVCDGVSWIFQQAEALKKPAVINISLGEAAGPHDGNSLANRCLDALIGPGRIIVASAGNQGAGSEHGEAQTQVDFHARGKADETPQVLEFYLGLSASRYYRYDSELELYFYHPTELTIRVGVRSPQGETLWGEAVATGGSGSFEPEQDDQELGDATIFSAAANRNNMFTVAVNSDEDLVWLLEVKRAEGDEGQTDGVYDGFVDTSRTGGFIKPPDGSSVTVNNEMTIGYPAVTPGVLSVGSYVSRTEWMNASGEAVSGGEGAAVGALSDFSALGPSRDLDRTGVLPDITGPGQWIVTSLGTDPDRVPESELVLPPPSGFAVVKGTSFSAPAVAGAVALMLEAEPSLSVDGLRSIIQKTAAPPPANSPEPQKTLPNLHWGYGKFNAEAAMLAVGAEDAGAGAGVGTPPPAASPSAGPGSTANDSGGCAASGSPRGAFRDGFAFLLALTAAMGAFCQRFRTKIR